MTRCLLVALALLLSACTTARDGQRGQVDPRAWQMIVVGF